jgi:hypothetical protein
MTAALSIGTAACFAPSPATTLITGDIMRKITRNPKRRFLEDDVFEIEGVEGWMAGAVPSDRRR